MKHTRLARWWLAWQVAVGVLATVAYGDVTIAPRVAGYPHAGAVVTYTGDPIRGLYAQDNAGTGQCTAYTQEPQGTLACHLWPLPAGTTVAAWVRGAPGTWTLADVLEVPRAFYCVPRGGVPEAGEVCCSRRIRRNGRCR